MLLTPTFTETVVHFMHAVPKIYYEHTLHADPMFEARGGDAHSQQHHVVVVVVVVSFFTESPLPVKYSCVYYT